MKGNVEVIYFCTKSRGVQGLELKEFSNEPYNFQRSFNFRLLTKVPKLKFLESTLSEESVEHGNFEKIYFFMDVSLVKEESSSNDFNVTQFK